MSESPWTWVPNGDATRLHACHRDETYTWHGQRRQATACGLKFSADTVPVTGHQPPRCKRCERITRKDGTDG